MIEVAIVFLFSAACGLFGFALRPSDPGPPSKPLGSLQFVDFVMDRSGVDGGLRIGLDAESEQSKYIEVDVGIDSPPKTSVRWAVVLSFAGTVRLSNDSAAPIPTRLTNMNSDADGTNSSTYVLQGAVPANSSGYTSLKDQSTVQFSGADIYAVNLGAKGLRAAAFAGSYVTMPVAVGVSDNLQAGGLSALSANPAQLLRSLDVDTLGWIPQAARSAIEYQTNVVASRYVPEGVDPPQSASSQWYWNIRGGTQSTSYYSTGKDPSALASEQVDVFWSGVLLALSGSGVLGLLVLLFDSWRKA